MISFKFPASGSLPVIFISLGSTREFASYSILPLISLHVWITPIFKITRRAENSYTDMSVLRYTITKFKLFKVFNSVVQYINVYALFAS